MDLRRPTGPVGSLPSGSRPLEPDAPGLTADITHPDWPMAAGGRLALERIDDAGGVFRTEITVLTETLTVASRIEARVVHDVVMANGALVADRLTWYAQDAEGNVWHLGQQTAALAPGRVVTTAGSWEAGVDGARAAIVLPATWLSRTSQRGKGTS